MTAAGTLLWEPTEDLYRDSGLAQYLRWLDRRRGLAFGDYTDLWRWSVDELDAFWSSIWEFEAVDGTRGDGRILADDAMPGAKWFPGATLNYGAHLVRHGNADAAALICLREDEAARELTWAELRRQSGALAATLRRLGIDSGDRVVAYLPNGPEAVVCLIACAAIGAVWSVCAPDFGAAGVAARFAQLEPKVLIAADGYRFGGREYSRGDDAAALAREMEVDALIEVRLLGSGIPAPATSWEDATAGDAELTFEPLPFEHPLWVLFSSGTTGVPKGIVHGHGGILLEHLKQMRLHCDLRSGERFLFLGSTSWMVWNLLVAGLLVGSTPVLVDGSPTHPDLGAVWRTAAELDVQVLGVGAGYLGACMKAGIEPRSDHNVSRLRSVISTGSPLSPSGFQWVMDHVGSHVWLVSASGGTDVCSSFVGGSPLVAVRAGRIQARQLGVAVEAYDGGGRPVIGQTGELVVTRPMPSMPLRFWGDETGERYRASYFDIFPGIWRHGDFIRFAEDGSCEILGRSDSTLNRRGVRMGSAEIYAVVEALPEVREALVIGAEMGEDDYFMPLFVHLFDGADPDATRARIVSAIRAAMSPRHVPDEIVVVPGIPHTRTGKKLEIPVKRLIQGHELESVVDRASVDDPDLLEFYVGFARERQISPLPS